jgi:transposase
MERKEVYIGLDYHSLSVQVCVLDKGGRVLANRSCGNSVLEVAAVVPEGALVAAASIESCCGAFDLAEALRDEIGWPVTMAHPGIVNRMRHNPDKSDYSDARMLAALSRAGFVPPVWLAPPWVRELRLLVRLRADLAKRRRAVKTRILAVLRTQRITEPDAFNRWTKGWLARVRRRRRRLAHCHFQSERLILMLRLGREQPFRLHVFWKGMFRGWRLLAFTPGYKRSGLLAWEAVVAPFQGLG